MKKFMTGLSAVIVLASIALSAVAALDDKSVRDRTMPVGKVCIEGDDCGSASAAVASGPMAPEDIYSNSCAGCHASGALSAPKFGDAAEWTARLDKGMDQLIANAIGGINAMPPMGTCASCSEEDIGATVQYMVDNSK